MATHVDQPKAPETRAGSMPDAKNDLKSGVPNPRSKPSTETDHTVAGESGPANTETGLASEEASRRLKKFGPNTVPDTTLNPLRMALAKFWRPFPGCSKPR